MKKLRTTPRNPHTSLENAHLVFEIFVETDLASMIAGFDGSMDNRQNGHAYSSKNSSGHSLGKQLAESPSEGVSLFKNGIQTVLTSLLAC